MWSRGFNRGVSGLSGHFVTVVIFKEVRSVISIGTEAQISYNFRGLSPGKRVTQAQGYEACFIPAI